MTDKEIIEGLIARDEKITGNFFFVKCRPLMYSIIRRVFAFDVDYDELINELYVHIMENDAARLRSFAYNSSIYQWLKTVAIRFFQHKRDRIIENASKETPYDEEVVDSNRRQISGMDLRTLVFQVENLRYRWVLQKIYLEDASPESIAKAMGVTIDNFYNIKKRATTALLNVARKDNYGD